MELAESYPVLGLGMGAVESWGSATIARVPEEIVDSRLALYSSAGVVCAEDSGF
jgi:hypothetical protein